MPALFETYKSGASEIAAITWSAKYKIMKTSVEPNNYLMPVAEGEELYSKILSQNCEQGSRFVYADKITRTESDEATGEASERAIPFMKGYTVFNVDQIDGLPEHYYAKPEPRSDPVQRIAHAESFFAATAADIEETPAISSSAGCRLVERAGLLFEERQVTSGFENELATINP